MSKQYSNTLRFIEIAIPVMDYLRFHNPNVYEFKTLNKDHYSIINKLNNSINNIITTDGLKVVGYGISHILLIKKDKITDYIEKPINEVYIYTRVVPQSELKNLKYYEQLEITNLYG